MTRTLMGRVDPQFRTERLDRPRLQSCRGTERSVYVTTSLGEA